MWNIDTSEGMKAAKTWQRRHFELLAHNATWGVPRAATVYQIDKHHHIAWRLIGPGDVAIERVMREIGWQVRPGGDNGRPN
jgi:hypothetical protein